MPQLTEVTGTVEDVLASSDDDFRAFTEKAVASTWDRFKNRRILFNPLYVSNVCINDCAYCGYRRSNRNALRRTLTPKEAVGEARVLAKRGIRHVLILAGEYSKGPYFDMLRRCIGAIRDEKVMDWIGVEVAPLNERQYAQLRVDGVNSVTVFQETYDRWIYTRLHEGVGPKGDFDYRAGALNRAISAGIMEVGLGVLYGLGDWFADTCAMAEHARHLQSINSELKVRFSFPRLMPSQSQDTDLSRQFVDESMLSKSIIAMRLAFPGASLVLTGRESKSFLLRHAPIADVLGKAGSTAVGGYTQWDASPLEQFSLNEDCALEDFRKLLTIRGFDVH